MFCTLYSNSSISQQVWIGCLEGFGSPVFYLRIRDASQIRRCDPVSDVQPTQSSTVKINSHSAHELGELPRWEVLQVCILQSVLCMLFLKVLRLWRWWLYQVQLAEQPWEDPYFWAVYKHSMKQNRPSTSFTAVRHQQSPLKEGWCRCWYGPCMPSALKAAEGRSFSFTF